MLMADDEIRQSERASRMRTGSPGWWSLWGRHGPGWANDESARLPNGTVPSQVPSYLCAEVCSPRSWAKLSPSHPTTDSLPHSLTSHTATPVSLLPVDLCNKRPVTEPVAGTRNLFRLQWPILANWAGRLRTGGKAPTRIACVLWRRPVFDAPRCCIQVCTTGCAAMSHTWAAYTPSLHAVSPVVYLPS